MTPFSLYRLAGAAATVCATLLVFNAARRAGALPENGFTHAIAPFAALAGLFTVAALYLVQRAESGVLGLVGFALNAAGLAGAFAIEYTLHFVFPYLGDGVVDGLVDGATGRAFAVTGVVLVTGVALFGVASWRARILPAVPVALYVGGMIPGSLRTLFPAPVYLTGLVVAAAGVAWLGLTLRRRAMP
ncbi:hypothetical protein [Phytohabitans rumicis]|uniref:Uncharacterized protein n=1 Tax=Phytohabitans rumicis TaxID=1076125 RepID=A0A6V8LIL0_9ACTN|nr:hypothetical protein [Phytohabitans rumicis]GFJ94741.1 hypothetical protein Prum_083830 [Phytohabitans rumicis]